MWHSNRFIFSLLAGITSVLAYSSCFAGYNSVGAQPSNVFLNTPTQVTFVADIQPNAKLIKTGVRLLKEVGGVLTTVGTLYDDGTHGDAIANDNKYTVQLTINEPNTTVLNYRVSSAYSGVVQREQSSVFSVNIIPPLNMTIMPGENELYVKQGQSASTAFTLTIQNQSGQTAHLTANEAVSPVTGLDLISDYSGGWSTNNVNQTYLIQNTLTGQTVGDYTVTVYSDLTLNGISKTASASILVHVLPADGEVGKLNLSSTPSGLQSNSSTNVLFAAAFIGGSAAPISGVLDEVDSAGNLIKSNVVTLKDDGTDDDVTANDGLYSGNVSITAGNAGTNRYYRATGQFAGDTPPIQSAIYELQVIPYTVGFLPGEPASIVEGSIESVDDLGATEVQEFYCDQVMVIFKSGTPFSAIDAAAASVNGSVAASEPDLNAYQLSIPCNGTSGVQNAITTLMANPDVESAEPNALFKTDEIVPNDTSWNKQYAPTKIRADEAWVVSRGGTSIAILDTGVDSTHPDLSGKVINGWNFTGKSIHSIMHSDFDFNSHGTHCAGIAAAKGNNALGMAGISWNSKILTVQVLSANGKGSASATAGGILYASTKAKILSLSLGSTTGSKPIRKAVAKAVARGALVIAAAGNDGAGMNKPEYPCSYPSVLCVGSTTNTDARSYFSTYGPQVDIAAPGSNIYSTIPVKMGSYSYKSGTSMATPLVAGTAALVWSRFPSWSAAQVQARLIATAMPLPGLQIGPRVDAFDAVFNGNFEDGLNGWNITGTGSAVTALGPISPTKDKTMGMASTGPDSSVNQSDLWQTFTVQPGVANIPVKFSYALITEEYPEYIGSVYNDNLSVVIEKPDGTTQTLAFESVNSSSFTAISGINFPGGDNTAGWTGWKNANINVPITNGPGIYRIHVSDQGDGVYDTNMVVDNLRFK